MPGMGPQLELDLQHDGVRGSWFELRGYAAFGSVRFGVRSCYRVPIGLVVRRNYALMLIVCRCCWLLLLLLFCRRWRLPLAEGGNSYGYGYGLNT